MANIKKIRQFGQLNTEKILYEVDRAGTGYSIESQFPGCGYILKGNSIVMLGGKNGILTIDKDKFLEYVWEMLGIYELAEMREKAGIKYNFRHLKQEEIS